MNAALVEALSALANAATIATAFLAAFAYAQYRRERRRKRKRIESCLQEEYLRALPLPGQSGALAAYELAARAGMTEADVLDAIFSSELVQTFPGPGSQIQVKYQPIRGRP